MPRATLIIACDQPDEVAAAKAWFDRWHPTLTYVSGNDGCGCCVDIYHVEGSAEAIAAVPAEVSAQSEWSHSSEPPGA